MALSTEAMKLLVEFRQLGNPGDPHPNDRERWRKFVIQAHDDGDEIIDTDVSEVLRQQWHSDVAIRLGGEYVEERILLIDYDESR